MRKDKLTNLLILAPTPTARNGEIISVSIRFEQCLGTFSGSIKHIHVPYFKANYQKAFSEIKIVLVRFLQIDRAV